MATGTDTEAPPSPGIAPYIQPDVPSNGSDQRLSNRAKELAADREAQRQSAYGSDRRLYNQAQELSRAR